MTLDALRPFLGDIDAMLTLVQDPKDPKKTYAQPALKNLGSIVIPIVREVISPASFRNEDPEITDIDAGGRRIRAVPNKFKYAERSRGLQVSRFFGAGGAMPQNKTAFQTKDLPSKGYDLNTVVFGDSADHGKLVLPVKAAAQYSDAISVQPYDQSVDATFHNRAAEDGTLFDAAEKKNSVNLFERHFILPGTLLIQTICFNGRTAPVEALEHLLLSIGLAGAYGGQTSIYGVNVRNHIVGIYAGRFERDLASPYVALERLGAGATNAADACARLDALYAEAYAERLSAATVAEAQAGLIAAVESNDAALRTRYQETHKKVGAFFDAWFGIGGGKKGAA